MTRGTNAARLSAVRGALLTGHPDGRTTFVHDGLLVFDGRGKIRHAGRPAREWARVRVIAGGRDALIAAAFWDPHVHLPQLSIAGRHGDPLLTWLRRHALPAERRHRDAGVVKRDTVRFFDALEAAGTAGAGIFTAPFPRAARIALDEAARRELPVRIGPPLMDLGDTGLERPASRWLPAVERLFELHGRAAAVVPRFGPSCSDALLTRAGRLARSARAFVLGHVSENEEEVAAVRARTGSDYVSLYARAGLLGPRSLYAHGVHLSGAECRRLAATRTWIVHCPTSNEALGSGRMPLERLRRAGVRWCLGSDVGAGRALCMLDPLGSFLEIHARRARTVPAEAFWRATFAGAAALGFAARRGALTAGRQADFLLAADGAAGLRGAGAAVRMLVERWHDGAGSAAPGRLWRDGRPAALRRGRRS